MLQGATLSFEGWAANGEGQPPTAVAAFVDGLRVGEGECGLPRPDVVARRAAPALANCGFRIVMASDQLARGMHRLAFAFSFEGAPGEMSETYALEVYTRDVVMPPTQARPRVLVVAAPKSGSSYVAQFLIRYFRIDHLTLTGYSFEQEHILSDGLVAQLEGRPFVMHLHMLPRVLNLEALNAHAIAPVLTWRNLADTVISYDDHVRNEGVDSAAGTFTYINDRERYLALPEQSRYQFLIRHMLPWYIDFYLGWRDAKAPLFMHYERLVDDPAGYFAEIIATLSGTVDEQRLNGLIGPHFEGSRFNVGRNGRALEKMSEETRGLLEEILCGHYADLGELIDELPWRNPRGRVLSEAGR